MTKKDKLRILIAIKKIILIWKRNNEMFPYLCLALSLVLNKDWGLENKLIELGIEKPKGIDIYHGWWGMNDYESRLKALNKAIKRLQ